MDTTTIIIIVTTIGGTAGMMAFVRFRIRALKAELQGEIRRRFASVENRISIVEKRLEAMEARLANMEREQGHMVWRLGRAELRLVNQSLNTSHSGRRRGAGRWPCRREASGGSR